MSVPPSSWLVIRRRKYPRTSCWVRVDPPCGKTTAGARRCSCVDRRHDADADEVSVFQATRGKAP